MAKRNLSKMSVKELEALEVDLAKQRTALREEQVEVYNALVAARALETIPEGQRAAVLARINDAG